MYTPLNKRENTNIFNRNPFFNMDRENDYNGYLPIPDVRHNEMREYISRADDNITTTSIGSPFPFIEGFSSNLNLNNSKIFNKKNLLLLLVIFYFVKK